MATGKQAWSWRNAQGFSSSADQRGEEEKGRGREREG